MTTPTPPAGWLPDPADPALVRYWDGAQWTDQTNHRFTNAPKKPLTAKKVAVIAGAVVAALGAYIAYSAVTAPSAEEVAATEQAQAAEDSAKEARAAEFQAKSDAQFQCEKLVEDRLKAPATAEFTDMNTRKQGVEWITTGAVDSQNSFGANIRTTFTCTTSAGTTVIDSIR